MHIVCKKVTIQYWLIGLIFALVMWGCGGNKADDIHVRKVLLDLNPQFSKVFPMAKKDQLRTFLKKALKKQKQWQLTPDKKDAFVLRITLDGIQRSPSKKGGKHLWVLTAELQNFSGQAAQKTFSGYAAVPHEDGDGLEDTFQSALNQGFEQIYSATQAMNKSTKTLMTWLLDETNDKKRPPAQKRMAIQVLGSRKAKEATEALQKVLLGKEPALAQDALLALTLIGDPKGLDAVFDYAERKPAPIRKKAIVAAQLMGGKYAAAWLFTMSTGHEDPSVRYAAANALRKVEEALKKPQKKK